MGRQGTYNSGFWGDGDRFLGRVLGTVSHALTATEEEGDRSLSSASG